jgi:phosphonate transport system substrate-binding protein
MSFIIAAGLMLFNPDTPLAEKPEKLVIAIQPTASPQQLVSRSGELETFLEERMNLEVEIFFPTNYAGVVEALRFGHAHAAFMGSWPAVMAQNRAGARVVLAEIREVIIDGEIRQEPYYFSYWVVPRNSPYKALAELRGRRAAFPSQISSSGYVAPVSRLVELGFIAEKAGGVDPGTFFSEVIFSGGYAQAWEALKNGQVDISVIAGDVPESLYRTVLDNTRILETQGPIPSHVVVVSNDLDAATARKLEDALLELNSGEDRELMRKFVSGIFVRFERATEAHLAPLQRMLNYTGFEFQDKGK